MAEAATVIQLVQFTGLVLSCCYEYISKAKHAPKEIQRVIDEISSLKGILENLKPLANAPNDERYNLLKSLNRSGGPFQACSDALKEIDKTLSSLTDLSNIRRRLQWPLEAGKIEETIQKLESHKITFILAFAGIGAASDVVVEEAIGNVQTTVEDIQAKQLQERILAWLDGPDPGTNFNAALKKKEAGTCEWLLRSKQLQSFTEGQNQLMWLHGIPGAGKTVLTSAVVEHLSARSHCGGMVVIYYYFDFNDQAKQTSLGCLRSLVRQICMQSDGIPKDVLDLHSQCKGASPTSEQLVEILELFSAQESRVFIVIDALDECKEEEEEQERTALLGALRDIKSSTVGPFNIFVASRPEADIKREMSKICDIDLDVQVALVDEDIRCHVRSCLTKDIRLKRWPENIKKEIENKLTSDSNGMFRWAVCQLAELRKCLKLPNIRKELGNLPKTLDATYTRILKNIPSIYQRELRMVLMFLACSKRPMTLQEVAEATAVNLETQSFSTDERFPDPYDLLDICSSLVSLSHVSQDPQSTLRREGVYRFAQIPEDIRILQFAHFSVKEYILSDRAQNSLPPTLIINDALSHSHIIQTCLIYIIDFNNGQRATKFNHEEFPLLAYAALNWTAHLSSTEAETEKIDALLVRLFNPENENSLMNYLNLYDPNRQWRSASESQKELSVGMLSRNKQDFAPPIYYACYYGLGVVVKYLLSGDEKTRPNKEAIGSGLAAAAAAGHLDTVELLLKEGADPNSPYCGKFWRPLHAAAASGNSAVVKRLLEAGSMVNAHSGREGGALSVAAEQGNPEVIELLINHGADLYSWSEFHGPPLSAAILSENDDAVAAFVRNKIDVNKPPDGYFNSLSLACSKCSIETVQLLLDSGANAALQLPNSQALQNASLRGSIDIMQLLIDRGGDINGDSPSVYRTPLKSAIQSHDQALFEFMLHNGADINLKGSSTQYPIDLSIFGGNLTATETLIELGARFGDGALEEALDHDRKEYLAKMLIDRGANVNAEHRRYGNILQFAAMKSSPTAVRWLLEAGSDPNDIPGGEYGTPLQVAAYFGREEIVRLLLDHGACVNPSPSGVCGTPLQAAILSKNESIIQMLLSHGADVNVMGGKMGTSLQAAAMSGLETVVKALLSSGADINAAPSGEYGTALRAALATDREEIVKILLEKGADLNVESKMKHTTSQNKVIIESYSFPLEVAAATNNPRLVQLLLNYGLDINSSQRACSRALQRASEMPDCTMLEFLIKKGADVKKAGGRALSLSVNRHDLKWVEKVEFLLKHGANANGDPASKMTPLSSSIHHQNWDVMRLFLNSACDVNAIHVGLAGCALNEACEIIAINVVKELLDRGADINIRAGTWGTPLICAIMKGDEQLYQLLLKHGAEVDPKPPFGYYGTPLQAAISKGYYEMANDLLDRGANPNGPGLHVSPLTGACGGGKTGQIDLIERLLSLGADIEAEDIQRPKDDGLFGSRYLWTPLQYAAYSGRENILELLLARGAQINSSTPKGTYGNALQAATKSGNQSTMKLLLGKGADANAIGGEFGTALQAAAEEGSDSLITLLLEAGANPRLEGGTYGSPLQAASRLGRRRHVELFLDHEAPTNTNSGKYGNPLAAAAKSAARETAEILISRGADVNQFGGKYGTPLQAACCATGSTAKNEDGSVIRILIEKGAHVNAREVGKYGTALQAAAYHNRKYVDILLENGADPNIKGGKFGSALNAARQKGLLRVVKLLLDHGAIDEEME